MNKFLIKTGYTCTYWFEVDGESEKEALDNFYKKFYLPVEEEQSETKLISVWEIQDKELDN